ncbi:MAG: hypothetical protein ACI9X4_001422 [Glaciecola sp.]|jgi:hypothetical protein
MKISNPTLSLLAAAFALQLAPEAAADFSSEAPPTWRGTPQTEFSGWEEFIVAFGGGNVPDVLETTSDDAFLEQLTPGAIITSTLNIYHPSGTPVFQLTDSVPSDLVEVVLQLRTFGNPLETATPVLNFLDGQGQNVAVPFSDYTFLGSAGGAAEHSFTWELCDQQDTILSYSIFFEASASNMSLDRAHLDSRFDGDCGGSIGTNYCQAEVNSTGFTAAIVATGSESVAANDLTLTATGMPLNEFGYFLGATAQGFIPLPAGSDGNICLGGQLARFNQPSLIRNSGATGEFSASIDLTSVPTNPAQPVLAGQTWSFQCWHRDGVTSNFTDGVSISFQ